MLAYHLKVILLLSFMNFISVEFSICGNGKFYGSYKSNESMLKTFVEKYSNLIKNGKKWRESRGLCLSLEINANDNTFIKQFLSCIIAYKSGHNYT
jgi:hypothetical protein